MTTLSTNPAASGSAFETTKDEAALILIRKAIGLELAGSTKVVGSSLQKCVGSMTKDDRRQIDDSMGKQVAHDLARWNP